MGVLVKSVGSTMSAAGYSPCLNSLILRFYTSSGGPSLPLMMIIVSISMIGQNNSKKLPQGVLL